MDEHCFYLVLGSNIAPEQYLPLAIEILNKLVQIGTVSSIWESPAVGSPGPNFLNVAIQVQSSLQPDALKHLVLRNIEAYLGRQRMEDNAPRTIDIDIVIVDGNVIDDQVWKQAYLAIPLAEIIPEIRKYGTGESLKQRSKRLAKRAAISKRTDLHLNQSV